MNLPEGVPSNGGNSTGQACNGARTAASGKDTSRFQRESRPLLFSAGKGYFCPSMFPDGEKILWVLRVSAVEKFYLKYVTVFIK